jgi:hypothetical protein
MTLEFIAAAQDYKQRWEALKDFYRWRKYPEEKPENGGRYYMVCEDDDWDTCMFIGNKWDTSLNVQRWTNLPPIEDK